MFDIRILLALEEGSSGTGTYATCEVSLRGYFAEYARVGLQTKVWVTNRVIAWNELNFCSLLNKQFNSFVH